jgi:hypothetical protein
MRRDQQLRSVFGHKLTALLLLLCSLLLPIVPLIGATVRSRAEACACCRRHGAIKCSHGSHDDSGTPSWQATMACASGGAIRGVVPSPWFLVVGRQSAAGVLPAVTESITAFRSPWAKSAYSAYLYQRPPPLN